MTKRTGSAPSLCAVIALSAALAGPVNAQITWDREFYDLGGKRFDLPEADLILPLPCNGGAMAFQRIAVAVEAENPLADRAIRLGQSGTLVGYIDYLREDFLRGAFTSSDAGGSHYYIARYELTELQYAALTDPDCANQPEPSIRLTTPKLGLSWFDATDLARSYTEWLRLNEPDALPEQDGQPGYLRLPTEPEWEFAARGGEAVDPLDFGGVRPPMDGDLSAFAQYDETGPTPVGAKEPNPLLLFDMLGNAEELMLEPFRLNAVGHTHGQVGGIVTRGGSFQSTADDIRSSRRSEWAPYSSQTGLAQAQDTFGVRLVVTAHVLTKDEMVDAVQAAWQARFQGEGADPADNPVQALQDLIAGELDPARKAALESALFQLAESQAAADAATSAQTAATLEMATVMLENVRFQDARLIGEEGLIDFLASVDQRIINDEAKLAGEAPLTAIEDLDLVAERLAGVRVTKTTLLETITRTEQLRRDLLTSYREALDLLSAVEDARFDRDFALFQDKLAARGNDSLAETALWMRDDLRAFANNPSIDAEALLSLARETSEN